MQNSKCKTRISPLMGVVIVGGCLFVGCGKSQPAGESTTTAESTQASAATESSAPPTLESVFPPGPGREQVLDNCTSCHALGCTTKGQRNKEQWDQLKGDHKDKLGGSSQAELDQIFTYLAANFNDTKPEPKIPEDIDGPCTPY